MISAAGPLQVFVPYGREYCKRHPGEAHLVSRSDCADVRQSDAGHQNLLNAIRDFTITSDSNPQLSESWLLRASSSDGNVPFEEELYYSKQTAVWSCGSFNGRWNVIKSFTVDSVIQQALWCNFLIAEDRPYLVVDTALHLAESEGAILSSTCIIDSSCLYVFAEDGREYLTTLPFQVKHAWSTKYGLLLERQILPPEGSHSRDNRNLPTLFNLLHPLSEITPVVMHCPGGSSARISYLKDIEHNLVYTSTCPSLAITYDTKAGGHLVWRVRRARPEEGIVALYPIDPTLNINQQFSGTPTFTTGSHSSGMPSRLVTGYQSPSHTSSSPFRSQGSRIGSPSLHCWPSSPVTSHITHMAAISRSQSPTTSGSNPFRYEFTSSPSGRASPMAAAASPFSPNVSASLTDHGCTQMQDPLAPEVCLELLWTEPRGLWHDKSNEKASKVFLTSDVGGQKFLCYLISSKSQLRLVKLDESNDGRQLIFGTMSSIEAKDASPLEGSDLMLILDPYSSLVIFSGFTKICKVMVSFPSTPRHSLTPTSSYVHTSNPDSRRCSIITSSRPPSAMDARFDEEVHLLSPVLSQADTSSSLGLSIDDGSLLTSGGSLVHLRDPVNNRVILEHSNGSMYIVKIPTLSASPLVKMSLMALQRILPKEMAIQLFAKWYCTRFALGSGDPSSTSDWHTFASILLSLIGYNVEKLRFPDGSAMEVEDPASPGLLVKKFKVSGCGSDADWEYLLSSSCHKSTKSSNSDVNKQNSEHIGSQSSSVCLIEQSAPFFSHIASILFALHLVYEDVKLNTLMWEDLKSLSSLLYLLSRDLGFNSYTYHYIHDLPQLYSSEWHPSQMDQATFSSIQLPSYFTLDPPNIFGWLDATLKAQEPSPFPYLPFVCKRTRNVVLLYSILMDGPILDETVIENSYLNKVPGFGLRSGFLDFPRFPPHLFEKGLNSYESLVLYMTRLGITLTDIETYPCGVVLPIRSALYQSRSNPPAAWPKEAYALLGREDLTAHCSKPCPLPSYSHQPFRHSPEVGKIPNIVESKKPVVSREEDDGMDQMEDEVAKLLFNRDLRIREVRRLLQTSRPVRIALTQRLEVSDHEFIDDQKRHLYAICIRTMAIPVGRGMFTLRTSHPVPTETLPIPKLCLTGRAPPRNTAVDLSQFEVPPNMNLWPLFHNGVAAGLKIAPTASEIDSSWIVYNKPKGNAELPTEHAGLLMALGLNGHLKNLAILNIYDYVSKAHEMTNVGLLLGLAASKRGSMDPSVTKLLSIHVDALLPPTSTELDVSQSVRVASLLSLGLLYEGTAHGHTTEVLLSEIGRPPGPEMENSTDRESYSLAAGLALGLVTFGKGGMMVGLHNTRIANQLYHYMVGGHKPPVSGLAKELFRSPSYQIKEGDAVNVDVTSPGATLALGMMFFATGNSAVANWMTAPDTQYLLDFVRPDFLLLRTLSKSLVLWDEILPKCSWVECHLPALISSMAFTNRQPKTDVDYETMSQAYCNILAGACMALGLRFAGSSNEEAYQTLLKYARKFISLQGRPIAEQAGKTTMESCLNIIVLSLAMVVAGTGDLEVLRIVRHLRSRVGQPHSHVLYGSHMATHMALGLLFLGGGKLTLSTCPSAVAALLCAFYPKFPAHSNDNRYHLQAFRHLFVLAVEQRLIIPRDIVTRKVCYTHLKIVFKNTQWYKNIVVTQKAPALLPELSLLEEVSVCDNRYQPMVFHYQKNWDALKSLLASGGTLYVMQKAGCLSYIDDPQGYRSLLSQGLVKGGTWTWVCKLDSISSFTSDIAVGLLAKQLNPLNLTMGNSSNGLSPAESSKVCCLCRLLYECITQEKLEVFPALVALHQVVGDCLDNRASTSELWQVKLALSFTLDCKSHDGKSLLRPEFALALQSQLETILDHWAEDHSPMICQYMAGVMPPEFPLKLAYYLTFYNIPSPSKLKGVTIGSNLSELALNLSTHKLAVSTLLPLMELAKFMPG